MTQETPTISTIGPSQRELQIELELWLTRKQSIQNAVAAVQAQAQLLPLQLRDVEANIARLQAILSPPPQAAQEPAPVGDAAA